MPNYAQGKIYQISSPNTEKIYIGSTTKKYLSERLVKHRSDLKLYKDKKRPRKTTSFQIIEAGDAIITLLELFPCQTKDELTAREGEWIRENIDICVNNKINVGLSFAEQCKKWRKKAAVKVRCEICNIQVGKRDYKRHTRSKTHLANLQ